MKEFAGSMEDRQEPSRAVGRQAILSPGLPLVAQGLIFLSPSRSSRETLDFPLLPRLAREGKRGRFLPELVPLPASIQIWLWETLPGESGSKCHPGERSQCQLYPQPRPGMARWAGDWEIVAFAGAAKVAAGPNAPFAAAAKPTFWKIPPFAAAAGPTIWKSWVLQALQKWPLGQTSLLQPLQDRPLGKSRLPQPLRDRPLEKCRFGSRCRTDDWEIVGFAAAAKLVFGKIPGPAAAAQTAAGPNAPSAGAAEPAFGKSSLWQPLQRRRLAKRRVPQPLQKPAGGPGWVWGADSGAVFPKNAALFWRRQFTPSKYTEYTKTKPGRLGPNASGRCGRPGLPSLLFSCGSCFSWWQLLLPSLWDWNIRNGETNVSVMACLGYGGTGPCHHI